MAEQTCKDCNGTGETEKLFDGIMTWLACCTCDGNGRINRTGPYRLADGTWSDGVDRTHSIPSHEFCKANPDRVYVHGTYDLDTLGKWQPLYDVWRGNDNLTTELTLAEAIAYADRIARGEA